MFFVLQINLHKRYVAGYEPLFGWKEYVGTHYTCSRRLRPLTQTPWGIPREGSAPARPHNPCAGALGIIKATLAYLWAKATRETSSQSAECAPGEKGTPCLCSGLLLGLCWRQNWPYFFARDVISDSPRYRIKYFYLDKHEKRSMQVCIVATKLL